MPTRSSSEATTAWLVNRAPTASGDDPYDVPQIHRRTRQDEDLSPVNLTQGAVDEWEAETPPRPPRKPHGYKHPDGAGAVVPVKVEEPVSRTRTEMQPPMASPSCIGARGRNKKPFRTPRRTGLATPARETVAPVKSTRSPRSTGFATPARVPRASARAPPPGKTPTAKSGPTPAAAVLATPARKLRVNDDPRTPARTPRRSGLVTPTRSIATDDIAPAGLATPLRMAVSARKATRALEQQSGRHKPQERSSYASFETPQRSSQNESSGPQDTSGILFTSVASYSSFAPQVQKPHAARSLAFISPSRSRITEPDKEPMTPTVQVSSPARRKVKSALNQLELVTPPRTPRLQETVDWEHHSSVMPASPWACYTPPPPAVAADDPKIMSPVHFIKQAQLVVGDLIGRGAFGDVHCGNWGNRVVAIKHIYRDDLELSQIEDAIEVLAGTKHPNVLPLLGISRVDGMTCLILEKATDSLYDWIERQPEITSIDQAVLEHTTDWLMQTLSGLEYLHKIVMFHGSLNSRNLLLFSAAADEYGDTDTVLGTDVVVKISDYCHSAISAGCPTPTLGGTSSAIWMPPEQLNTEPLTPAADIWALGVICWELLTNQHPYSNAELTDWDVVVNGRAGNLRPAVPQDAPYALRKLLSRCWSTDPLGRPSCAEFIRELAVGSIAPDDISPAPSHHHRTTLRSIKVKNRESSTQCVPQKSSKPSGNVRKWIREASAQISEQPSMEKPKPTPTRQLPTGCNIPPSSAPRSDQCNSVVDDSNSLSALTIEMARRTLFDVVDGRQR